MTFRISFDQALAFAVDRGAIVLWCEGEDLRYKAYRPTIRPPYQLELVNGYMKLGAPLLEKYPLESMQLQLPFNTFG